MSELREIEYEEKRVNERLALYDMDKSQFTEEKERLITRSKELQDVLGDYQNQITMLDDKIQELTKLKNTQQTSK
ncbi:hypothetical protein C1Y18_35350, partial [Pseudomonas sp. MPR-R5A]